MLPTHDNKLGTNLLDIMDGESAVMTSSRDGQKQKRLQIGIGLHVLCILIVCFLVVSDLPAVGSALVSDLSHIANDGGRISPWQTVLGAPK